MRASRTASVLFLGACLLLVGSASPACAHDIGETGLCAAQCVLHDLAGDAAAVLLDTPARARAEVSREHAAGAVQASPLDIVRAPASPRAPPRR